MKTAKISFWIAGIMLGMWLLAGCRGFPERAITRSLLSADDLFLNERRQSAAE